MQPEVKSRLLVYHDLLLKWQKSVNLVAPSTLSQAWARHFEDSLQVADLIPPDAIVADIGSGAGFPGLVLAIARPDLTVHLIESDTKKAAFLSHVSRETGAANVHVHTGRIESVLPGLSAQVVTARALAALDMLLGYTVSQWDRKDPARLVFLKGENWRAEVEMARAGHRFELDAKPSKTAPNAAILCIRDVTPLPGA